MGLKPSFVRARVALILVGMVVGVSLWLLRPRLDFSDVVAEQACEKVILDLGSDGEKTVIVDDYRNVGVPLRWLFRDRNHLVVVFDDEDRVIWEGVVGRVVGVRRIR